MKSVFEELEEEGRLINFGAALAAKLCEDAIDTLIIRELSKDELVGSCLSGESNSPVAPSRRAIVRARASLPPYCKHSFEKNK